MAETTAKKTTTRRTPAKKDELVLTKDTLKEVVSAIAQEVIKEAVNGVQAVSNQISLETAVLFEDIAIVTTGMITTGDLMRHELGMLAQKYAGWKLFKVELVTSGPTGYQYMLVFVS